MSELYYSEDTPQRIYWDRKYYSSFEEQVEALHGSSTLYIGNLSFFTSELQIHETFSRVGPVKRIIMGLNRESKTPCGFCFVEYYTHEHARECLKFINGTMCDDRKIRCELDGGFKQGRQFGRGVSGGQIRDERRTDIDLGRGGVLKQDPAPVLGKRRTGDRDGGHQSYRERDDRRRSDNQGQVDAFGRDRERTTSDHVDGGSTSTMDIGNTSDYAQEREDGDRPLKNPRFREEKDDEHDDED